MRKILIFLLMLILILPVSISAGEEQEQEQDAIITEEFGPSWLDFFDNSEDSNIIDDSTSSRASSRSLTVPPAHLQQAISYIVDQVEQGHEERFLKKLVGFGSRLYRAPGMYNASKWLYNILDGNGRIVPEYHNFTVVRSHGTYDLSNVILTLPGKNLSSDKIYYLFAHSDAVQGNDPSQWLTNTPGADDDGSGCAATLEAARVLSRYDFQDTIKFAFFNAEEIGLIGSSRYAQTMAARAENVPATIDYDMIGYSSGNPQYGLDLIYSPANANIADYLVSVNNRYNIGLTLTKAQTSNPIPSDIQSYYNSGFPGVLGIETNFNPYYHTTNDVIKHINFSLIHKSTEVAVASLAEWARLLYTDLSIPPENINLSKAKPNEDDNVEITVNVTNIGNLDAYDVEVVFYMDGSEFASKRLSVPANGTNVTSAIWQAVEGNHNISVIVDPTNEVVEIDETNNSVFKKVGVNDRPKAILTAVPMSVLTYENITFNGSFSEDLVGGISDYYFEFGDGDTSGWIENSTVTHSYDNDGTYMSSLIVRDSDGAHSKQFYLNVTVNNRAPIASPYSNVTRTKTFVPIQFYANATDEDGDYSTKWYFDDGSDSVFKDPEHTFTKSGIYDVQLYVEDDDEANSISFLRIYIDNRPPSCSIDASAESGDIKTGFTFNAAAVDKDGEIVAYQWDFGDGSYAETEMVDYRYSKPGYYNVRLTVIDDEGAEGRASLNMTISDQPPVANGDASKFEVLTYEKVFFYGDKSSDIEGPLTYLWDFDDGNVSADSNPTHSYSKVGEYNVALTVFDYSGQNDTVVLKNITVLNRLPSADFWSFGNFTQNGTVYFDGSNSSDTESDLSHFWNFGDGETGTGRIAGHEYKEAGSYQVYLTVTDSYGETASVSHTITVSPPPAKPFEDGDKEKKEEDGYSSLESSLMYLNLIWIIIVIIVIAWAVTRKRKTEEPKPAEVDSTVQEAAWQQAGYPSQQAYPLMTPSQPVQEGYGEQVIPQAVIAPPEAAAQTTYALPPQPSPAPEPAVEPTEQPTADIQPSPVPEPTATSTEPSASQAVTEQQAPSEETSAKSESKL